MEPLKPFSLLVKPASADCNLRCRYCFYLDRCELYPQTRRHRMSDTVLAQTIRSFLHTAQPTHAFGWQGGEPTLMGRAFFERVITLQQQHARPGAVVSNGLQTNGTLMDDALAEHLGRYHFLVGVSLDGPAGLHDPQRITADGGGSHADVLRGIETLRRHGVEFNVLTLVNACNATHPETVYDYLNDLGIRFHQYIECVEFDARGQLQPFAVDAETWGAFLCRVFDRWYPRDVHRVSIRLFDTILSILVDGEATACSQGRDCRSYFVVEYNGDVYPCDFFVRAELRLGNILETDWHTLQAAGAYRAFGARKRQRHPACAVCAWLRFCNGDCPKNRAGSLAGGDSQRLSALCAGWRRFFAHALPRFEELAQDIRKQRKQAAARLPRTVQPGSPPPPRNRPCSCGSGRKFKHCCGKPR